MLDLSAYGKIADKMEEFVNGMEKTTIISSDLTKLSEIIPSLSENLSIISNWINGTSVVSTPVIIESEPEPLKETVVTDTPTATETAPKTTENRIHHHISKEEALEIGRFIADKCDGRKLDNAIAAASNKFKKIPARSIDRLVRKETFDRYTDKYFIIDNDIIVSVINRIPDKFGSNDEDLSKIADMIRKNNYDVIKTIAPDMSPNDILKIAVMRWSLFKYGEVQDLGGGVKEIFIMAAIANNKRRSIKDIIAYVKSVYHIDVDTSLVSAVRTGRAYKEIAAKFGVV